MRARLVLSLLSILLVTPAQTQVADEVEALVEAYHAADRFNGSALVSDGGDVVWAGGVGVANAEWTVPNTADTRFRIGSVTKQFTAALVLQLMEQGLVDLHVPVSTYVPEVPVDERITTHHLLTHTSGLFNYTSLPDLSEFMGIEHTPAEVMARIEDKPLDFEPGDGWQYSNTGYILLGMIVENVTGQSFADALQDRLLDPLGLTATAYDDGTTVYPNAASGYSRSSRGLRQADHLDPSVPYAAGMMRSTMGDLMRWSDALFEGRVFESPETLALMNTAHAAVPNNENAAYGYGVFVGTAPVGDQRVTFVQHGGGINGFTTSFWRLTDRDAVIALSSNTQDGSEGMAADIAALLYGEEVEAPKPSSLAILRGALETGGVSAVETAFEASQSRDDIEVTEDDLNRLGYEVLETDATETAVALFRLNVAAYPDAWNPRDSLGEALLAAGDTTASIASYREALERNPGAASARDALTALGVDLGTVTVPAEVLARYVGMYQFQPGLIMDVRVEEGVLIAHPSGQGPVALSPVSETEFVPPFEGRLVFESGDPSPAAVLYRGGAEMRGVRIDEATDTR